MAKRLAIGVAGGGIGGLAAAILLARAGAGVVLYDQMERPRPLGSGLILQPVGLAVLGAIGAGERIRSLGARIDRLFGRVEPSGRVVLDVRYDARGGACAPGLAVHRGALFEVLLEAAQAAGVSVELRRRITATNGMGRFRFADGATSAKCDLLVDAMGTWSQLSHPPDAVLPFGALWATLDAVGGFDPSALEQRYRRASRMAGVLPVGRMPGQDHEQVAYFWSLKHADHADWARRGLVAWKDEAEALWPQTAPLLRQVSDPSQLVFAAYAHRTRASPAGRGLAHVGDSWRCASPQLGQGANMALLDALALATAIERQPHPEEALADYARMRVWHTRLYQLASWMFTPAYQSDGWLPAAIRDWVMAPVSRIWPAPGLLARLVAGELMSPLHAIGATTVAPATPALPVPAGAS
jgi:salicylate hydroxylase